MESYDVGALAGGGMGGGAAAQTISHSLYSMQVTAPTALIATAAAPAQEQVSPRMHTECIQNAYRMHTECIPNAYRMHTYASVINSLTYSFFRT